MSTASKTAAVSTQSDAMSTQNVTVYQRHPVDLGNRYLKWFGVDGQPHKIPAYLKELESHQDMPSVISADSVVIELDSGDRYVLGRLAQELGGYPVHSRDKCRLAEKLVLAALEPKDGHQILVECLPIALPDSRKQSDVKALQRIARSIAFKRNGKQVYAMVRKVRPVDECLNAWKFAHAKGLFRYCRLNAILDFGGGTTLGRIISPLGVIDRDHEVQLPGTFNLANKIAAVLQPKLKYSADLGLIMDAIEDGSYQYPTHEGAIAFEGIFSGCRDRWLDEIRAKLRQSWTDQLSAVGEILIVGGSAHLAESIDGRGRYKIARYSNIENFAQFISLYGMSLGG